jgi:hypothetical protein
MTAAGSDVADGRHRRPIRIGISACLLGEQVRFDGGHKRDAGAVSSRSSCRSRSSVTTEPKELMLRNHV